MSYPKQPSTLDRLTKETWKSLTRIQTMHLWRVRQARNDTKRQLTAEISAALPYGRTVRDLGPGVVSPTSASLTSGDPSRDGTVPSTEHLVGQASVQCGVRRIVNAACLDVGSTDTTLQKDYGSNEPSFA